MPRRTVPFLLLLLAACQTSAGIGPNAREGAARLPDMIGSYRRAAPPALLASNGALAGSFSAYQQLGGPGRGVVEVPETPSPGASASLESAEFGRAFEQALEGARLAAASRQASLTVRNAATIRRNGEALLRCWQLETSDPGPTRITAHCMGLVVDRYVQVVVRTADTPGEWQAAMQFAVGALSALRANIAPPGEAAEPAPPSVSPPPGYRPSRERGRQGILSI